MAANRRRPRRKRKSGAHRRSRKRARFTRSGGVITDTLLNRARLAIGGTRPIYFPGKMPVRANVHFKACLLQQNITLTAAVNQHFELQPNNPLDPFGDAGGLQFRGWDEWTGFYKKFCCTRFKVTAIWCRTPVLDTTNNPRERFIVVGLLPSSASGQMAVTTTFQGWCGFPRAKYRHMCGQQEESPNGSQMRRLTLVGTPKSYFQASYGTGSYDTTTTTPPTNIVHVNVIWASAVDANFIDAVIYGNVRLEVETWGYFFDRQDLTQSVA